VDTRPATPVRTTRAVARMATTLGEHLQELGIELDPVLEQLNVPVYLVDSAGKIRWQNAAAVALTGHSRGRHFWSRVAPEHRHRARASFIRQMLGNDGVVEVASVALGPDGSRRPVLVSRIPLENADGVVGVFGIARALNTGAAEPPGPYLTPRQHETLRLLAQGLSTDEVAAGLGVARETARNYIRQLLRALGARSRLEAVVRARELGLVSR
jgi:PAS domain S-box-containing protein